MAAMRSGARSPRLEFDFVGEVFFAGFFVGLFRSTHTQLSDLAFQVFDLTVVRLDSVLFIPDLLIIIPDSVFLLVFDLLDSVLLVPDLLVVIPDSVTLFVFNPGYICLVAGDRLLDFLNLSQCFR